MIMIRTDRFYIVKFMNVIRLNDVMMLSRNKYRDGKVYKSGVYSDIYYISVYIVYMNLSVSIVCMNLSTSTVYLNISVSSFIHEYICLDCLHKSIFFLVST